MNSRDTENIRSHFTPMNDQNSDIDRMDVQLLIYPGEMLPERVTDILQVAPTRTTIKGAPRPVHPNRPASLGPPGNHPNNCWFLMSEYEVPSKDIRRHLDWLIERLWPVREAVLALQRQPGVQMRLSCVIWTTAGGGCATLWPEHMRALADLNLECTFEFADYGEPES